MSRQNDDYHFISADSLLKIADLGVEPRELEVAAALENNGVKIKSLSNDQLLEICHQACIIHEEIINRNETRFTLYDMIDAMMSEDGLSSIKNFVNETAWYEAVLHTAIEMRRRYTGD